MKIESSSVQLAASYRQTQQYQLKETLEAWKDPRPATDTTRLSPEARRLQQHDAAPIPTGDEPSASDSSDNLSPQLRMIKDLVEQLTGRTIHLLSLNDIQRSGSCTSGASSDAPQHSTHADTTSPNEGWGVDYQRQESYQETQMVQFSAQGSIQTSDGKTFSFSVDLQLSSEVSISSNEHLALGDATRRKKDPLVINYAAPSAQLTDATQSFDLDADGVKENLKQLATGSGFLALDRNGDGQVNNGSELFGTQSGNGFADLAQYDSDKNGWIDESDAVYGKLSLWVQGQNGGTLLSLKDADVGAIFLGQVATPFQLSGNGGELATSGVFLKDSGGAGSAQQVDLYA